MVKRKKEIAETKILYDTKNRTFQTELDTDQMEINKNLDDNNNKIKKRGRHLEKLKEFYDKHNKKVMTNIHIIIYNTFFTSTYLYLA